ncbi:MAG: hypothetical protein NTX56_01975 [Proteobacteria bacterium]|nr:hypothetical protein [Pseudomonadota bacterium]
MAPVARTLCCCCLFTNFSLNAAPLDAFLAADTQLTPWQGQAEIGYDAVNDGIDVFKVRANDPVYGGSNVGDYNGFHLRGIYQFPHRLSLHGDWWQRQIKYRADKQDLHSWVVAVQYRLFENNNWNKSNYALRVSAWGNEASTLTKSSPTSLFGRTLDSVSVSDPKDRQFQLDLLGSWRLSDRLDASAFVGTGKSQVSVGAVGGTITDNGCAYNLSFSGSLATATLANPCGSLISASFTTPGPDIGQEVAYHAKHLHAGGMLQWRDLVWRLSGGYQYQRLIRDHVDDLIASRGGESYRSNHVLVGEIARKVGQSSAIFLRGQLMSNQFVGEIPFAYNSVTASKFSNRYGLASVGFMQSF